jgi:hypothetical protein
MILTAYQKHSFFHNRLAARAKKVGKNSPDVIDLRNLLGINMQTYVCKRPWRHGSK